MSPGHVRPARRERRRPRSTTRTRRRSRCSTRGRAHGREEVLEATEIDAGDAARAGGGNAAGRARSRPRSPRQRGCLPRRSWPSGAATRWRRPSAPASSRPAKSATWSARPSRSAPRRPSRARTRPCSSSATRTPTPTCGCSRTPASSRAATSAGGATSSPRSNAPPRPKGWATRTTSCPRRRRPCPPGAEGLVFLPCMQGAMAPEWNGAARGMFYGLTLAHSRAHMTRAVLEGSAFGLRDILEAMVNAGLDVRRLTIVGGGAKGPLWRQIKADVTGLPVRVPVSVETTATGAAILAAVGVGGARDGRRGRGRVRRVPAGGTSAGPGAPGGLRRRVPPVPRRVLRVEAGVRRRLTRLRTVQPRSK